MNLEKNNKKQFSGEVILPKDEDKKVVYEKSCDMEINHSDLKLELIKFSKAIRNEPNFGTILTLLSLWIVIFNANFNDRFGLSGRDIFIISVIITCIFTIFVIKPVIIFFLKHMTKFEFIKSKSKFLQKWHYDNEIDPEKKADNIIKKCNRKL